MVLNRLGWAGGALLLLAACGDGESTPGQPSAEERRALDNIAAKQDAELQGDGQTFDTSADSLVPADGTAADANAAGAAEAPPAANSGDVNAAGTP